MPTTVSPRMLQRMVLEGFNRMKAHRKFAAMALREYTGRYFSSIKGMTCQEPVNLIFNTIRVLTPHLVMKNPINEIYTPIKEQKDYAFLLQHGLNNLQRRLRFKHILRAGIVSSFFSMGLFKTGIAASGQKLYIDDIDVDPGSIYTDIVDLDNFTIDPRCTDWDAAVFMGDRIRVPRQILLDTDGYDHDLVNMLPRSGSSTPDSEAKHLTQPSGSQTSMDQAMDYVDVVEVHVPDAEAIVTIADPAQFMADSYVNVREYYGPKAGPYRRLVLTPPVPGNPLPIAPVSVWYDVHLMANRSFTKMMAQADRQRDIAVVDPALADQAEDMRLAEDGEVITGDPDRATVLSFGGQNPKNEAMLSQLQIWYNYIAGNPDQIAGIASDADTATQATILQNNATVALNDMKDMVYDVATLLGEDEGWYMHYDPFIDEPIGIRTTRGEEVHVRLTAEQVRGDFLSMNFKVIPKSMERLDPNVRAQRVREFGTNIMPSAVQAAMMMWQSGQPFDLVGFLMRIADELQIGDIMRDVMLDEQFEERMMRMQQMNPIDPGKGKPAQPGSQMGSQVQSKSMTVARRFNQAAQTMAAQAQRTMKRGS